MNKNYINGSVAAIILSIRIKSTSIKFDICHIVSISLAKTSMYFLEYFQYFQNISKTMSQVQKSKLKLALLFTAQFDSDEKKYEFDLKFRKFCHFYTFILSYFLRQELKAFVQFIHIIRVPVSCSTIHNFWYELMFIDFFHREAFLMPCNCQENNFFLKKPLIFRVWCRQYINST